MPWTSFIDMHSGGGLKEKPYTHIYIEAPEGEAKIIFYNRFGHSPDRVSCTCCGEDYSVYESSSLGQATGFERGCQSLETPHVEGRYKQPEDPWWHEHYYLEPDEVDQALGRGYKTGSRGYGKYKTLNEYRAEADVLFINANEISAEERQGSIPQEGYVWV